MTVKLYEWDKTETGGAWIEITDNKVVNLKLREENNLIEINEDDEAYVDLQLADGIAPDDDFPVWVTTGRVLVADWRPVAWTVTISKTTSWDYTIYLYGDDGKVYVDNGTGVWKILARPEFVTQTEYDNLPASKNTDNLLRIVVDNHNETYTITFEAQPSSWGSVSPASITAYAWDPIVANGNVLTIWNQTVTATQSDFREWKLDNGEPPYWELPDHVEWEMNIIAGYVREQ